MTNVFVIFLLER